MTTAQVTVVEVGNELVLDFTVAVDGTPTDPTACTLTITTPDGVPRAGSVTRSGVGTFSCTFLTTQSGEHVYLWQATGTAQASRSGHFYVTPHPSTVLFEVDELSAWLRSPVDPTSGALVRTVVTGLIAAQGLTFSGPGDVVPPEVKGVALTAAARAYTNPQGLRGETVGPYTVQHDPHATVYLTLQEIATLEAVLMARGVVKTVLGVGSIRVTPGMAPPLRPNPSIRSRIPGTLGSPEW
jgi:hypothetical protein